jgi:hypothetical protein
MDSGLKDRPIVSDTTVYATLIFDGAPYELTMTARRESYASVVRHHIMAFGLADEADRPKELIDLLLSEGMANSPYRNAFLFVSPGEQEQGGVSIKTARIAGEETLDDIFLSSRTKDSLRMFTECLLRFNEFGQPMRFLLCGKPGTAKTKTLRALANTVRGNVTVLFAAGGNIEVMSLFRLAECLSPALVCIDDLDLLVGDRDQGTDRQALGKFLQSMDGFISSSVFVLATTNDKKLVDIAASRPGRFDQVLDVEAIDTANYLGLVKTKTDSEFVVSLFEHESVLTALEAHRVTGAFIAALVKHCSLMEKMEAETLDEQYLLDLIASMQLGFYRSPRHRGERVGFVS